MLYHYVLTRFNQGFGTWHPDNDINVSQYTINPWEWLCHRICLFDKYFLPSVNTQTNKNFLVILSMSVDTPKRVQEKYSGHPNLKIVYDHPAHWLMQNIPKDCSYLITTRVDNDDAFSKDFIDLIQINCLKTSFPNLIDFFGLKYDSINKLFYNSNINTSPFNISHFLSVGCKLSQGLRHCFESQHTDIYSLYKNKLKVPVFAWLEVVHEFNICNNLGNAELLSELPNKNFSHIF